MNIFKSILLAFYQVIQFLTNYLLKYFNKNVVIFIFLCFALLIHESKLKFTKISYKFILFFIASFQLILSLSIFSFIFSNCFNFLKVFIFL